ncbi:MAG: hypothetical protein ACK53Y_02515, partial [bacterium]
VSLIRGVVFQIGIYPRIRSQNRIGSDSNGRGGGGGGGDPNTANGQKAWHSVYSVLRTGQGES